MPDGIEIRQIDENLLATNLANLGEMRGWIDSFWHSPTDFLKTGLGYCALAEDEATHQMCVAAWCLTVFAAGSARELGLATLPNFRQRGLATLTAAASVEHILSDGLTPEWHCDASNPPSSRIAEKVGFRLEREYSGYHFSTVPGE